MRENRSPCSLISFKGELHVTFPDVSHHRFWAGIGLSLRRMRPSASSADSRRPCQIASDCAGSTVCLSAEPRLRTEAARVIVAPEDMLSELSADDRELARNLRSVHELCDEHNDVATASLIENWIDGTQRRAWVPVRSSWHVRPERDEPC
jgi:hypothetical protein